MLSNLVIFLIIVAIIIIIIGIRIVDQWQKGIVFRLGKFAREIYPGLNIIIPFMENVRLVDMRVRTMDVVPQEVMSKYSSTELSIQKEGLRIN